MDRDFVSDFLMPAIENLSDTHKKRVAIALDAAICFGALEAHAGNPSLQDVKMLEIKYNSATERLK